MQSDLRYFQERAIASLHAELPGIDDSSEK
jgi:hypothetical protein